MNQANGLRAVFTSRRNADLAIEHLVQEHGIERDVIFVEAVDKATEPRSHPGKAETSSRPVSSKGDNATRECAIQVTVAVNDENRATAGRVLREAGAQVIRKIA